MKKKVSAKVMPKTPDMPNIIQSLVGRTGKSGMPANQRVGTNSNSVTTPLKRFKAIGEKVSPLFLNMMTAAAQQKAAPVEQSTPIICMKGPAG
jgi:hypothetical protein